jgi:ABC-type multidrug transport system fused ATPase/permease subunit
VRAGECVEPIDGHVEFRSVTMLYSPGRPALQKVDLDFPSGSVRRLLCAPLIMCVTAIVLACCVAGCAAVCVVGVLRAAGQITALVGSSGAGKSSIASVLLRLYEPTQGMVTIDGR